VTVWRTFCTDASFACGFITIIIAVYPFVFVVF
jgi:hypothetical protein